MRAALLGSLLLLTGCGGRVGDEPASPIDAGDADVAIGFDLGPEPDTAPIEWDVAPPPFVDAARGDVADPGDEWCPPTPPTPGTSCKPSPYTGWPSCTYGDSVAPECRVRVSCSVAPSGAYVWQVERGCHVDPKCPATAPTVGDPCAASGPCGYGDGTLCACSGSHDSPRWACYPPPSDCPTFIPNAGVACASEGALCGYGAPARCSWGRRVTCSGGRWRWMIDCAD